MPALFLLLTSPHINSVDQTSVILANALKKSSIQVSNSLFFPFSRRNHMQVSGGRAGVPVGTENRGKRICYLPLVASGKRMSLSFLHNNSVHTFLNEQLQVILHAHCQTLLNFSVHIQRAAYIFH